MDSSIIILSQEQRKELTTIPENNKRLCHG